MTFLSFPAFFSTLKGKITLWFIISIAAFMIIFSGMLLFSVRLWMIQSLDTDLMNRGEALKHEIQATLTSTNQVSLHKQILDPAHSDIYHDKYFFWIIDSDTTILFSTVSSTDLKFPENDARRLLNTNPVIVNRVPNLMFQHRAFVYPITGDTSNILIKKPVNKDDIVGWIVIAASIQHIQDFINNLTRVLIGMMVISLIIATAFALILSDLALRPLQEIVKTAQTITARQLNTRIRTKIDKDEVGQLVKTLNELFDRLEGSFRQIRQFSADASHELLTPLTIIKGEIELALDKDRDKEYYKTSLSNALTQTNHLIQITQTLLKLSREENLEEVPDEDIMDLRILFSKITKQLDYVAAQKNITIQNKLDENIPLVNSNENLLHTLFFNLIENAVKYSPENTIVVIKNILTTSSNGQTLSIQIIDQGHGIPDSEKSNIFLRFYRVDKSRSKSTGGTGLGLSLVSKIVKLLGLSIEVKDNHPQGTIIEVRFEERMVIS